MDGEQNIQISSTSDILQQPSDISSSSQEPLHRNKQNNWLILGLIILFILILGSASFVLNQNFLIKKNTEVIPPTPYPTDVLPTETSKCIDSNGQCEGKSDGTSCSTGLWCDELGRICGGKSCVGMGLGKCLSETCIFEKDYSAKKTQSSASGSNLSNIMPTTVIPSIIPTNKVLN